MVKLISLFLLINCVNTHASDRSSAQHTTSSTRSSQMSVGSTLSVKQSQPTNPAAPLQAIKIVGYLPPEYVAALFANGKPPKQFIFTKKLTD